MSGSPRPTTAVSRHPVPTSGRANPAPSGRCEQPASGNARSARRRLEFSGLGQILGEVKRSLELSAGQVGVDPDQPTPPSGKIARACCAATPAPIPCESARTRDPSQVVGRRRSVCRVTRRQRVRLDRSAVRHRPYETPLGLGRHRTAPLPVGRILSVPPNLAAPPQTEACRFAVPCRRNRTGTSNGRDAVPSWRREPETSHRPGRRCQPRAPMQCLDRVYRRRSSRGPGRILRGNQVVPRSPAAVERDPRLLGRRFIGRTLERIAAKRRGQAPSPRTEERPAQVRSG